MVYKSYFLTQHAYQLAETKQWVATGGIMSLMGQIMHNYRWDRNKFKTKIEAESYATEQMMRGIDNGDLP